MIGGMATVAGGVLDFEFPLKQSGFLQQHLQSHAELDFQFALCV